MRAQPLAFVASLLLGATLVTTGCGGSDPAPPVDQGQKSTIGTGAGGSGGLQNPNGTGPGTAAYPAGPFGLELNSTVADYSFLGLRDPQSVNFDTAMAETIAFHDYYNPTKDESKPRYLLVTASARWCPHCKNEAARSVKIYDKYHQQGVEFLTTLFEDDANPPNPATLTDLQIWTKSYKLMYPVGLDPKLQLGAFFNVSAAPFNMVVDLSDMTIKFKNEGEIDLTLSDNELDKAIAGQ